MSHGKMLWVDLTVDNATEVATFYHHVAGWRIEPVSMGDYNDYNCFAPDNDEAPVAGVCHRRGPNSHLPAVWMNYIAVPDLQASMDACIRHGGEIISRPVEGSPHQIAVIKDPGGAIVALYQVS
jgi:uncharacterized protein